MKKQHKAPQRPRAAKRTSQPILGTHGAVDTEEEELTTHLESFTCNVRAKLVRNDTMEGKTYKVVPMVMMVVGVHSGSQGALYYPKSELSKTPEVWNHKPVVVYHPTMNGRGISACSPDVLTSHKIGVIMNTKFDTLGRLVAEAWLDPDRIEKVDPRVGKAVDKLSTLECSTGMFMEVEATEGKFEGEDYKGVARNYRPDHLAVLPDKVGACSVKDGAGFIRNEAEDEDDEFVENGGPGSGNFGHGGRAGERGGSSSGGGGTDQPLSQKEVRELKQAMRAELKKLRDTSIPSPDKSYTQKELTGMSDKNLVRAAYGNSDEFSRNINKEDRMGSGLWDDPSKDNEKKASRREKVRALGQRNAVLRENEDTLYVEIEERAKKGSTVAQKYITDYQDSLEAWGEALGRHNSNIYNGLGLNEQSFENIRSSLDKALQERFAPRIKSDINSPYLYSTYTIAVYTDFVVFSDKDKLFKLNYTSTDTKVELSEDDPVEVVRVTEFRTVDGAFVGNTATITTNSQQSQIEEISTMNKKQIVDGLIANGGWDESDREFLMACNEAQLDKMGKKKADEEEEDPKAKKKAPVANSVEEFIGSAPAEMQDVLRSGLAAHQSQKNGLVDTIVGNASNKFTKEQLNAMPLGQLEAIAALAKTTPAPAAAAPATNQSKPNYAGQGGQAAPTNNEAKQEALTAPTINWAKK